MMEYYVYILLCQDGRYYTGYSQDVKNRLKQHMIGKGSRYTRMNKPERIVYMKKFETRSAAMKQEKKIKRLSHKEKTELISRL